MPQRLAQHLIARGLVPAPAVDAALKRMQREGGAFDTALLEEGVISEAGMLQALSDVSGVRLVNLADFEPNVEVTPYMPLKMARQLSCTPLSVDGKSLHVACAFPMQAAQLKDVGFLLGSTLELWVALECRVRDWQHVLYGAPLEPRFQRLLEQLDPTRIKAAAKLVAVDDAMSSAALEQLARGVAEEPILLDKPKSKGSAQLRVVPADEASPPTAVVDVSTLGRFSKPPAPPARPSPVPEPSSGPPLLFPGGMLPPRTGVVAPTQPPAPAPQLVKAASAERAARSTIEAPELKPPGAPARPPPPPPAPVEPPPPYFGAQPSGIFKAPEEPAAINITVDETDFSDVKQQLSVPAPALPPVPPPPASLAPQRPGARAPDTSPSWPSLSPAAARQANDDVPSWPSITPQPPAPLSTSAGDTNPSWPGLEQPASPPTQPAPPPPRVNDTPASRPLTSWPQPAASPAQEPRVSPSGVSQTPPAEWTLAQARAALKAGSQDREQLIGVVLDYAKRAFEYACSFAVLRGAAFGWALRGDGDPIALRELAIPLDAASVFRTVALTRGSYVGPLPPDALSQHYLGLMGRGPRTVFVWPVEVQSKLVAILYGDSGGRPVSQRRLADFILFCQDLPAAFHDLIVFRRAHLQQAAEEEAYRSYPAQSTEVPVNADPPTDAEWYTGLITLLTGPDPSERSMAMLELMRTPEPSAYALADVFPGPSGWSRLPVVELPDPDELGPVPGALTRLGEAGADALAPLIDAQDSDTRYLALLTAGSLRFASVVPGVLRGLFDYEPDISSAARAAASALKPLPQFQDQLPALRRELAATDPLRRSLAARALGVLHDREAIDGLINLAGSDDAMCATAASDALKEVTRQAWGTNTMAWTAWWARARETRRLEWLVEALMAEDFDSRLAAIEELSRAFGDNWGYFADGPLIERAEATRHWRAFVESRPDLEL